MFDKVPAKPQTVIVRKASLSTQQSIQPKPQPPKEKKHRYGKRFLSIRGKSIVADYMRDGSANLYVIEEGTKALLPVVANVPRENARSTAVLIARMIETYEAISTQGNITIELSVRR